MSSIITSKLQNLNDSPFYLSTSKKEEKQIFYFNLLKKKIYPKGMIIKYNDAIVISILNIVLYYIFDIYGIDSNNINKIINIFEQINIKQDSIENKLKEWKLYIQVLIFNLQKVVILFIKTIIDSKKFLIINVNKTIDKYGENIIIENQKLTIPELLIFLTNALNLAFNKYIRNGVLKDNRFKDIKLSANTNINLLYKHLYYKLKTASTVEQTRNKIYNFELYIFARLIIDKLNKLKK